MDRKRFGGGTDAVVKSLATEMARQGHDVTVWTTDYEEEYEYTLGAKIFLYATMPFYLIVCILVLIYCAWHGFIGDIRKCILMKLRR